MKADSVGRIVLVLPFIMVQAGLREWMVKIRKKRPPKVAGPAKIVGKMELTQAHTSKKEYALPPGKS